MKGWLVDHAISLGGTILSAVVVAAGKKIGLDEATSTKIAGGIMVFVMTHGFHQALDNHAEKTAGDAK